MTLRTLCWLRILAGPPFTSSTLILLKPSADHKKDVPGPLADFQTVLSTTPLPPSCRVARYGLPTSSPDTHFSRTCPLMYHLFNSSFSTLFKGTFSSLCPENWSKVLLLSSFICFQRERFCLRSDYLQGKILQSCGLNYWKKKKERHPLSIFYRIIKGGFILLKIT